MMRVLALLALAVTVRGLTFDGNLDFPSGAGLTDVAITVTCDGEDSTSFASGATYSLTINGLCDEGDDFSIRAYPRGSSGLGCTVSAPSGVAATTNSANIVCYACDQALSEQQIVWEVNEADTHPDANNAVRSFKLFGQCDNASPKASNSFAFIQNAVCEKTGVMFCPGANVVGSGYTASAGDFWIRAGNQFGVPEAAALAQVGSDVKCGVVASPSNVDAFVFRDNGDDTVSCVGAGGQLSIARAAASLGLQCVVGGSEAVLAASSKGRFEAGAHLDATPCPSNSAAQGECPAPYTFLDGSCTTYCQTGTKPAYLFPAGAEWKYCEQSGAPGSEWFFASVDNIGRAVYHCDDHPEHVQVGENCNWNCDSASGAIPSSDGSIDCVCAAGFEAVPGTTQSDGRLKCQPLPDPTINVADISLQSCGAAGVVITGSNFPPSTDVLVSFDGTVANVQSYDISANSVTVDVPAIVPGSAVQLVIQFVSSGKADVVESVTVRDENRQCVECTYALSFCATTGSESAFSAQFVSDVNSAAVFNGAVVAAGAVSPSADSSRCGSGLSSYDVAVRIPDATAVPSLPAPVGSYGQQLLDALFDPLGGLKDLGGANDYSSALWSADASGDALCPVASGITWVESCKFSDSVTGIVCQVRRNHLPACPTNPLLPLGCSSESGKQFREFGPYDGWTWPVGAGSSAPFSFSAYTNDLFLLAVDTAASTGLPVDSRAALSFVRASNSATFNVLIGEDPGIDISDAIVFGAQLPADSAPRFPLDASVAIAAPDSPPVPEVIVFGPSRSAICDAATLTGFVVDGGAFRPVTWAHTSATADATINAALAGQTGPFATIPAGTVSGAGSVSINSVATNWLSQSSAPAVTTISYVELTGVSAEISGSAEWNPTKPFVLSGRAFKVDPSSSCATSKVDIGADACVSFAWTVTDGSGQNPFAGASPDLSAASLSLSARSLKANVALLQISLAVTADQTAVGSGCDGIDATLNADTASRVVVVNPGASLVRIMTHYQRPFPLTENVVLVSSFVDVLDLFNSDDTDEFLFSWTFRILDGSTKTPITLLENVPQSAVVLNGTAVLPGKHGIKEIANVHVIDPSLVEPDLVGAAYPARYIEFGLKLKQATSSGSVTHFDIEDNPQSGVVVLVQPGATNPLNLPRVSLPGSSLVAPTQGQFRLQPFFVNVASGGLLLQESAYGSSADLIAGGPIVVDLALTPISAIASTPIVTTSTATLSEAVIVQPLALEPLTAQIGVASNADPRRYGSCSGRAPLGTSATLLQSLATVVAVEPVLVAQSIVNPLDVVMTAESIVSVEPVPLTLTYADTATGAEEVLVATTVQVAQPQVTISDWWTRLGLNADKDVAGRGLAQHSNYASVFTVSGASAGAHYSVRAHRIVSITKASDGASVDLTSDYTAKFDAHNINVTTTRSLGDGVQVLAQGIAGATYSVDKDCRFELFVDDSATSNYAYTMGAGLPFFGNKIQASNFGGDVKSIVVSGSFTAVLDGDQASATFKLPEGLWFTYGVVQDAQGSLRSASNVDILAVVPGPVSPSVAIASASVDPVALTVVELDATVTVTPTLITDVVAAVSGSGDVVVVQAVTPVLVPQIITVSAVPVPVVSIVAVPPVVEVVSVVSASIAQTIVVAQAIIAEVVASGLLLQSTAAASDAAAELTSVVGLVVTPSASNCGVALYDPENAGGVSCVLETLAQPVDLAVQVDTTHSVASAMTVSAIPYVAQAAVLEQLAVAVQTQNTLAATLDCEACLVPIAEVQAVAAAVTATAVAVESDALLAATIDSDFVVAADVSTAALEVASASSVVAAQLCIQAASTAIIAAAQAIPLITAPVVPVAESVVSALSVQAVSQIAAVEVAAAGGLVPGEAVIQATPVSSVTVTTVQVDPVTIVNAVEAQVIEVQVTPQPVLATVTPVVALQAAIVPVVAPAAAITCVNCVSVVTVVEFTESEIVAVTGGLLGYSLLDVSSSGCESVGDAAGAASIASLEVDNPTLSGTISCQSTATAQNADTSAPELTTSCSVVTSCVTTTEVALDASVQLAGVTTEVSNPASPLSLAVQPVATVVAATVEPLAAIQPVVVQIPPLQVVDTQYEVVEAVPVTATIADITADLVAVTGVDPSLVTVVDLTATPIASVTTVSTVIDPVSVVAVDVVQVAPVTAVTPLESLIAPVAIAPVVVDLVVTANLATDVITVNLADIQAVPLATPTTSSASLALSAEAVVDESIAALDQAGSLSAGILEITDIQVPSVASISVASVSMAPVIDISSVEVASLAGSGQTITRVAAAAEPILVSTNPHNSLCDSPTTLTLDGNEALATQCSNTVTLTVSNALNAPVAALLQQTVYEWNCVHRNSQTSQWSANGCQTGSVQHLGDGSATVQCTCTGNTMITAVQTERDQTPAPTGEALCFSYFGDSWGHPALNSTIAPWVIALGQSGPTALNQIEVAFDVPTKLSFINVTMFSSVPDWEFLTALGHPAEGTQPEGPNVCWQRFSIRANLSELVNGAQPALFPDASGDAYIKFRGKIRGRLGEIVDIDTRRDPAYRFYNPELVYEINYPKRVSALLDGISYFDNPGILFQVQYTAIDISVDNSNFNSDKPLSVDVDVDFYTSVQWPYRLVTASETVDITGSAGVYTAATISRISDCVDATGPSCGDVVNAGAAGECSCLQKYRVNLSPDENLCEADGTFATQFNVECQGSFPSDCPIALDDQNHPLNQVGFSITIDTNRYCAETVAELGGQAALSSFRDHVHSSAATNFVLEQTVYLVAKVSSTTASVVAVNVNQVDITFNSAVQSPIVGSSAVNPLAANIVAVVENSAETFVPQDEAWFQFKLVEGSFPLPVDAAFDFDVTLTLDVTFEGGLLLEERVVIDSASLLQRSRNLDQSVSARLTLGGVEDAGPSPSTSKAAGDDISPSATTSMSYAAGFFVLAAASLW